MPKLTPWFDGKLQSPVHNGWYDCKECGVRHYFKDGLWYRNKKSLNRGPMSINKMHWRGLAAHSPQSLLAQFDPSVPRTDDEQAWLDTAPVGREFGSPDYERLKTEDAATSGFFAAGMRASSDFMVNRERMPIQKRAL
jgi:hypothetical protein